MEQDPTTTPAPERNPYLWNRKGHTPFDEMDSLDYLEYQLQQDIKREDEALPPSGDHHPRPGVRVEGDDQ